MVSPTDRAVWELGGSAVFGESLHRILSRGNNVMPLLYTESDRIAEVGSLTILSCK